MGITYEDFLDLEYEPTDEDLVCTFRIDPATGMSTEAAASRVASESSNGTWAALQTGADFTDMGATTFDIDGDLIRVAYPAGLFEPGNMPQVLSCIAGNIMGMKAVDTIRLLDCEWPESVVSSYPGPLYGSSVREEVFGVTDRPITATVPKPKVGLSTAAHAQVGYDAWVGGVDLLKDDENLTDQAFNPFSDRLTESLSLRDDAEDETGEKKSYLINVTADTQTMLDRVDEVAAQGGEYVMVDIITAGWAGLQTVRERTEKHGIAIHAHRAMHAAFDRLPAHGVSMRVLAQVSRLCGVDQLHTGTAGLGKLANEDTVGINEWLAGDLYGMNDVLPVASGGLHPGLLPDLLDATGTNVCVQLGGGIHGHPDGTRAGAVALRSAIDAYVEGRSISEAAEETPELAVALDKWGTETPR
ncbi:MULTISPECIES: type III ribulose-bisphosphate carboxylase [Haloferax]|uniref:Ribulose bisphosphate carboxylase n=2 Tax=Haloferax gibbonsii TaxID=35746 RepID=A0A0K1IRH9_HALGI|nr:MULTISPECIES: type III ribulose-bisphosphate carboxylase [Haloferax]AKU07066.1 ribulose 1,5-bisphosphate carboxylase [Haloferax gibbonsii]ELZ76443.1 ribulose bisophosphate carboxylase [Haloferax gibbonsii ATCC 33959]RDZ54920.1 type III ribulose-bisphosphate carboxylase [Haloferax sp. Atlit-4N]REA05436.1 type III ribulose-bisphosphate carboxylase [Haloferax sp. Atlit-6N]